MSPFTRVLRLGLYGPGLPRLTLTADLLGWPVMQFETRPQPGGYTAIRGFYAWPSGRFFASSTPHVLLGAFRVLVWYTPPPR